MAEDRILIEFYRDRGGPARELDVPADITAQDLVRALNEAYHLGMNPANPREFHLQAEEPIALLRGKRTLKEIGLHNASRIYYAG